MLLSADQYWSKHYDEGEDFVLVRSRTVSKLLGYTGSLASKTCLDIGCGTGQLTRELFHRGYRCVGIDISSSAIDLAASSTCVPNAKLDYVHFDIERDDMGRLPIARYGLVTCKLVYAFIEDYDRFIDRVQRLLEPDGLVAVITPMVEDVVPEKRHIATTRESMELLIESFDQVAMFKQYGLTYFLGRLKGSSGKELGSISQ